MIVTHLSDDEVGVIVAALRGAAELAAAVERATNSFETFPALSQRVERALSILAPEVPDLKAAER